MLDPNITMPVKLWQQLMRQLKKRGNGKRESGAFLLGPATGTVITEFICYNDLDPKAFDSGIIIFHGDGFIPLWEYCSDNTLKVIADVHTHPSEWTGQSLSDQQNPMIAKAGHIALIVPCLAQNRRQLLQGVGAFVFVGAGKWRAAENATDIINLF